MPAHYNSLRCATNIFQKSLARTEMSEKPSLHPYTDHVHEHKERQAASPSSLYLLSISSDVQEKQQRVNVLCALKKIQQLQ